MLSQGSHPAGKAEVAGVTRAEAHGDWLDNRTTCPGSPVTETQGGRDAPTSDEAAPAWRVRLDLPKAVRGERESQIRTVNTSRGQGEE